MKLDIIMGTYDRFIPYIKSLNSIKPALKSDNIHLSIGVDTKLSNFKYLAKLIVTKFVLFGCNYSIERARDCIGKTRSYLITDSRINGYDYFMNFDDDDLINSDNLIKLVNDPEIYAFNPDIINFSYASNESYFIPSELISYRKRTWLPKEWFNELDTRTVMVGQSSIFKHRLYNSIPCSKRYFRTQVDDMLPNHVMYLVADKIMYTPSQIVIRNRGESSLMNTTNLTELTEMYESLVELSEFIAYSPECDGHDIYYQEFWNIVYKNHIEYHRRKSGDSFAKLLKDLVDLNKIYNE